MIIVSKERLIPIHGKNSQFVHWLSLPPCEAEKRLDLL